MSKISTNVTIDSEIKEQAQKMLSDFGLDLSTAINMFLRQMLKEEAIPFRIGNKSINETTQAALKEIVEMERHPQLYKSYSDVDELMKDLSK